MSKAPSSKKKKKTEAPTPDAGPRPSGIQTTRTMAVDIGGSGVKTMLLDESGKPLTDRLRAKTPDPSTPKAITKIIADFAKQLGEFDRVSVGFPGVIKKGVVYTAANLGKKWVEYPLAEALGEGAGQAGARGQRCGRARSGRGERRGRRTGDHTGNGHGLGVVSGRRAYTFAGDGASSFPQRQDL